MFDSGLAFLIALIAPVLLASAFAYAFIAQRRLTPAQRRDIEDAMDERYEDDEDDDCPVRVDVTRRRAGESQAASARAVR